MNPQAGGSSRAYEQGSASGVPHAHSSFDNSSFAQGGFGYDTAGQPSVSHQSDTQAAKQSRGPLYFLIFSAVVLIAVAMVIFMIRSFQMGRSLVGDGATSTKIATPAPSATSAPASANSLEKARKAVQDLAASPDCADVSSAVTPLIDLADHDNFSASDDTLFTSTLSSLSEACGADFTIDLQNKLTKSTNSTAARLAADTSWFHVVRPAGDGAISSSEFTTPANNIRCQFGTDNVACSIYVYDYVSPPGCEGYTATYTLTRAKETKADCLKELNSSVVANYGSTIEHNGFACTVDQSQGVECWSELSGHGFKIRRAEATTF